MEQNKKEQNKLTYEQLENFSHQLSERCKMLATRVEQLEVALAVNRLNFLFKVLDNAKYFPTSYVDKTSKEIIGALSLEEEEDQIEIENEKA